MIEIFARRSMKKTGLVPQYAVTIRRNVRVKAAEGVDRLTDTYSPRGQNQWL